MSRPGRRALRLDPCLDRIEEIADLDAAGLGTTEIQARLNVRRATISRVRALLRTAEARGYAKAVEDFAASERATQPFPKYPEAES